MSSVFLKENEKGPDKNDPNLFVYFSFCAEKISAAFL